MTTNYTLFQQQLFNQVAAYSSDPSWTTEFPLIIDRAEQRIYRDLDLLGTRVTDNSASLTPQQRLFTLPTTIGSFLVVEQVNVLTPAGTLSSNGSRIQLVRVSPQVIDLTWPSNISNTTVPEYFAMVNATTIMVGPAPDSAYSVEVRGTQRPTVLSSGNSSTILTQLLPDLFFAAGMIEAGMMMRYTEPQIGISWSAEYDKLLKNALVEEQRKKFMAEGWVDKQPSPVATPPRM
jgi:hypothetical protein